MATSETPVWGIHEGRHGEAESLALDRGRISIGWEELGNPSRLRADREAFKEAVAAAFPDYKAGAVPVQAGQIFRFVHEMQPGDLVVLPAKRDRHIHIGRLTGPYEFVENGSGDQVNQRKVEWLSSHPRTAFSQGALYESGSALTLFLLKNYADEFRAAALGTPIASPVADDESVAAVAEDIEETTRDFILKQLARDLKGHALEYFIAHLLEAMGYRARVTPASGDGGVDVIAHRDALGFEPPIIKVQVKSTEGTVGEPDVKQLKGNLSGDEKGLFVTLGTFSAKAMAFVRTVPNVRLIDGDELVKLVFENYVRFDSRYRAAIPLRQVYVPAPLTEGSD